MCVRCKKMYITVRAAPRGSSYHFNTVIGRCKSTGYPGMNQTQGPWGFGVALQVRRATKSLPLSLNFQSQPMVRGLVLQERAQSSRGRVEKVKMASRESGNSVAGVGGERRMHFLE